MDREYLASGMGATAAELREQLTMMTAASQLLERTATGREKTYLASLNRNICCMTRTVSRMELAHRLTDENEIRSFPAPMDLGPWTDTLGQSAKNALALGGITLDWSAPAGLLLNGDESLLNHMVLEMISAALSGGNRITLAVTRSGENVQFAVTSEGEAPEPLRAPALPGDEEEPFGVAMIRQVAQLHGGTLITCLEGSRFRSLTAILPQRMDLPAGRLASPRAEPLSGGFDRAMVAFSHILPSEAYSFSD